MLKRISSTALFLPGQRKLGKRIIGNPLDLENLLSKATYP